jgi:hypothetical protein
VIRAYAASARGVKWREAKMAITVYVRVVGLYLGNDGPIEVSVPNDTPTPAEVLTEVTKMAFMGRFDNVTGFKYSPFKPAPGEDLKQITVRYKNSFKSIITGHEYPAGIYSLSDETDKSDVYDLVWQYYLFGPDDKYLIPKGFSTPFSVLDKKTRIVDQGLLVFRLVAVAKGPIKSKRLAGSLDNLQKHGGLS